MPVIEKKISELNPMTPLQGNEQFAGVQEGETRIGTPAQLLEYVEGADKFVPAVLFRQGTGQDAGQIVTVGSDGNLVVVATTGQAIALIDTDGLPNGTILRLAFDATPGQQLVHNFDKSTLSPAPANLATLAPIWLQLNSSYTTAKQFEAVELQLIEYATGQKHWRDMSGFSVTGSVEPDSYIVDKAQQVGISVLAGTKIAGFANGTAGGATVYSTATWQANAAGNVIEFTGAGVLTAIKLGTEVITFTAKDSSGGVFGFSTAGKPYEIVGSYSAGSANSGLYPEHEYGCMTLTGGGVIIRNSAKADQVEDL